MDSVLPDDMKMEILSRTSLKTFDVMRCSNKLFNKLSYNPCLLNMHKKRNNIVSGLIVQTISLSCEFIKEFIPSRESSSLDLSFLAKSAPILASSEQGILVLETNTPRRVLYTICKPATKQILQLPANLIKTYRTITVAVDVVGSMPLQYKIVRISEPGKRERLLWPSTYCCEVFDSITWTWRQLSHVTLAHSVFLTRSSITTRGSIYILLTNNNVMKFDTYSEEWITFSSPNTTCNIQVYPYRKLVKYEGKLGFACKQLNGFWEIWVLTIKGTWEKTYVLNKSEDIRRMSLDGLYDSDMNILFDDNEVLSQGFEGGEDISKVASSRPPYETFLLRSDFEHVNLGGKKVDETLISD